MAPESILATTSADIADLVDKLGHLRHAEGWEDAVEELLEYIGQVLYD